MNNGKEVIHKVIHRLFSNIFIGRECAIIRSYVLSCKNKEIDMNEKKNIARIAVPVPIFRQFDYKYEQKLQLGARVKVPFGKRHLIGIVVEKIECDKASVDPSKLKSISQVLDESFLSKDLIDLARWIASYYLMPIGMVYELILPVKLRKGEPIKPVGEPHWQLNKAAEKISTECFGRAFAQRALFEFLQKNKLATIGQLNASFKQWRPAMKALLKKELVENNDILSFAEYSPKPQEQQLQLNTEQRAIVDSIENQFSTHLIHGVTGSGKTEVYLSIVEKHLTTSNQQALLLVPEISLTPQFVERVRQRLNKSVAIVHSAMNDSQRHKAWWAAKTGNVDIVIGTRASVFTAFRNLKIIIVDEEHDSSFKQQDGVRYHARDVAIMRAKQHNIPIVLGSATPSLEAWHNATVGKFKRMTLANRATGASLPDMHLINSSDPTERLEDGFTPSLIKQIKQRLDKKQQSILFINRRGFSPTLYCTECAWTAQCPRCDARVTAHIDKNTAAIKSIRCHHCGYQTGSQKSEYNRCGSCHQQTVIPLGAGTQRAEEALRAHFPTAVISRLDRDAITTKTALENELERIKTGEVDIIVGTQMLTKGHDFPSVTLVGVLDADQGLFALDFRGQEKLYQQLLQISGRAGRHQQGEVYIQTQFPEHPFYQQLLAQDYAKFAQHEIENRRMLNYPPLGYMSLLRAESTYAKQGLDFLRWCRYQLTLPEGVFVSDAVPAPMEKRAGRYRAQLMMHSQSRSALHQFQHQLISLITNSKQQNSIRWSLDVDPIDLY